MGKTGNQREYERLDERGDAELSGFAADEPAGNLFFPAFQELVKHGFLGTIHDERRLLALFVDDEEVFHEVLHVERFLLARLTQQFDLSGQSVQTSF